MKTETNPQTDKSKLAKVKIMTLIVIVSEIAASRARLGAEDDALIDIEERLREIRDIL